PNLTPQLTTWSATATDCFGSQASSYSTASSFLPSTPPLALICSMAILAPLNCMSPYWATAPVFGPAMPILMVSAANEWLATPAITSAANSLESFLVPLVMMLHSCVLIFIILMPKLQDRIDRFRSFPRQLYRNSLERRLIAWKAGCGGQNR